MEIIIYLALGAFAGFIAGLLGVGGGLIIVPVLATLFIHQAFDHSVVMHLAIGTSLASIIFTSISSVWAHHKRGAVRWNDVLTLTPGIITGAWLGAAVADVIPTSGLQAFFGLFELYVAIQMSLNLAPKAHRSLPNKAGMFAMGNVIGSISSIVGIGGGTLTVPFLMWCNVKMREAVASSSACGLPIAIAGAIGFVIMGWNELALPSGSFGFIYPPALLGIVATSVLFAPLGTKVAHAMPAKKLKRVFAILLYILAFNMLYSLWA